jgi:hypothetical protein
MRNNTTGEWAAYRKRFSAALTRLAKAERVYMTWKAKFEAIEREIIAIVENRPPLLSA